ncbi:MAG: DnaB-like helicase C-terminal domain-containing protein [Oscillospiraceae bacterium]
MTPQEIKAHIHSQSELPFLKKDKRGKGYICPCCGNGSGSSGDGIMRIPLSVSYKCFKCGESGDAFFWLGKAMGIDSFSAQLEEAARIYGLTYDKTADKKTVKEKKAASKVLRKQQATVFSSDDDKTAEYINSCKNAVHNTDYFSLRGISSEMIKKFGLGYDPEFSEGTGKFRWKAVIIPTSSSTYEARNTEIEPNSADRSGYKCRKHGRSHIFNGSVLESEKEKPVFITEGCFDAMSIIQCGGQAAALGGISNIVLLAAALDKVTPSVPLIIALDNDEAGRAASEKLSRKLTQLGISYIDGSVVSGKYHDPNDRLINDREGLEAAVSELSDRAMERSAPGNEQREQYLRTSAYYSIKELKEHIRKNALRPALSTGFYQIDNELGGGIYTGLYVIGAVSSLGKTTFSLQLADNLAKKGTDVLFFSVEQSRFELMAKSISRETFSVCRSRKLNISNAKSSLDILSGGKYSSFSETERSVTEAAFGAYESYSGHLFIYEGDGTISVESIREKVKDYIAYTGNKEPVVFIDYLQLLSCDDDRATDKQRTDRNITYLKQLSRDFDIPVIAVSSLNRQNYSEKINMAAFKESGAIEYGSDVLIGLQLKGAGEKDFDINAAKAKDPREVEFTVIKNRNGKISEQGIMLDYYPRFNCFIGLLDPYDK